jgi:hypothetical protein
VPALHVLAVLGLFVSVSFEFLFEVPRFPFYLVLGMSVGCTVAGTAYALLVQALAPR